MKCAVCGAENEAGAAFCYRCGSSLRQVETGTSAEPGRSTPASEQGAEQAEPRFSQPSSSEEAPPTRAAVNESERYDEPPRWPVEEPDHTGGARVYQVPAAQPSPYVVEQEQRMSPAPYVIAQPAAMPQTSNLAILSLIFGILSWTFLPIIAGIGAVITGHMGRREVQASNGTLTGSGFATAGLILGYINLVIFGLAVLAFCVLFAIGIGAATSNF